MIFHNLIECEQNHQQLPKVLINYLQKEYNMLEMRTDSKYNLKENKNKLFNLKTHLEVDT